MFIKILNKLTLYLIGLIILINITGAADSSLVTPTPSETAALCTELVLNDQKVGSQTKIEMRAETDDANCKSFSGDRESSGTSASSWSKATCSKEYPILKSAGFRVDRKSIFNAVLETKVICCKAAGLRARTEYNYKDPKKCGQY